MKKFTLLASLSLILILTGCDEDSGSTANADLGEFAQCLTDEGYVMYGTSTCPFCQQQKELFGDSFDKIVYYECDTSAEDQVACKQAGVSSVPAWIDSAGNMTKGRLQLERLAEISGCQLPGASGEEASTDSDNTADTPAEADNSDNTAANNPGNSGSFDQQVASFHNLYKEALFATGENGEQDVAVVVTPEVATTWIAIENQFITDQPAEYEEVNRWRQKLVSITDSINQAENLVASENFEQAHEELEEVRSKLKDLRAEAGNLILADYMLEFHDTMEELVELGVKNPELIEKLRVELEPIIAAEITDPVYAEQAFELEAIINQLEQLEGEEFTNELEKLKPAFIKIYLEFA
jgi:hypothetical protein